MNKRDILVARISQLSDEELKALLRLGAGGDHQVEAIAKHEAGKRGISMDEIELHSVNKKTTKEDDDWLFHIISFLFRT